VHVEADFQRKSELIQAKAVVLNDKERELRLLEQQLMSRECAISWHERQLNVKNSSDHAAASGGYWQQGEQYRGQMTSQEPPGQRQHAQVVFDHRQQVRPPGGTGWAVEKLEEQFAKLAQPGTTDISPQQLGIGRPQVFEEGRTEIKPRPDLVFVHPADCRLNTISHQNGPKYEFGRAIRKRGRPKGSKNRCKMPSQPALAVGGLPVRGQLMRHLYTRSQMLQNNPVMSLAPQMIVSCGPPRSVPVNVGMMANRMFAGGQPVAVEHLGVAVAGSRLTLSAAPRPPLTQAPLQSTGQPAVMPARVQQLLASAAFTTGASILPPLSPIVVPEFNSPVAGHAHVVHDSFQHGRSSGNYDVRKDAEYRVASGSDHTHDVEPEQAASINRNERFSEIRHQHMSDNLVSDFEGGNFSPVAVQCRSSSDHILPQVLPRDTGHLQSCAQLERDQCLHRQQEMSNHMYTTVHSADMDDDDDKRLVVVIDAD